MASILVISPTPSHPQDAGNRARIFSLLTALKAAGHRLHFVFVASEPGDDAAMSQAWDGYDALDYRRPADRWLKKKFDGWVWRFGRPDVLPYRVDDWYLPELNRQLQVIRDRVRPDVLLVEYIILSRAFECFGPEVLKILDTHDVFGERHKLYGAHGHKPVFFYTTRREEKRALDRADLVLAIQGEETEYFSRLTRKKVITVGHMSRIPLICDQNGEIPDRLLFVGSANHINMDGLSWFIETVFPQLRKLRPNIELDVVGQSAIKTASSPGLNLIGPVAELAPHYQRATLVINPLRFGTGLKIKTIEALAHGKPLVTTSIGAAGLDNAQGEAFRVADTPDQFCDEIISLLDAAPLRDKMSSKAQDYVRAYNKMAAAQLLQIIEKKTGTADETTHCH